MFTFTDQSCTIQPASQMAMIAEMERCTFPSTEKWRYFLCAILFYTPEFFQDS